MATKNYACRYCGHQTTATDPHIFESLVEIDLQDDPSLDRVYLFIEAVTCPNEDCQKMTLKASLVNEIWNQTIMSHVYSSHYEWQLLPESEAKVLPDYVPVQIQEDYYEACRIRDLSPKASATLARRCLQGMIRDFHGISKGTLNEEIKVLEEVVDPDTWASIDAIRSVGNIGAHMERDINVIVEVDPEEAQLLIGLIEQLVDDWYVDRENRRLRSESLKALAEDKKQEKEGGNESEESHEQ